MGQILKEVGAIQSKGVQCMITKAETSIEALLQEVVHLMIIETNSPIFKKSLLQETKDLLFLRIMIDHLKVVIKERGMAKVEAEVQ